MVLPRIKKALIELSKFLPQQTGLTQEEQQKLTAAYHRLPVCINVSNT